ncbi:pyridoxamine 5'-phosphate oxidase family protein [Cohnella soli]|uniref:Pyridoxamine 5'-phosphate oxidase family protein n=1 Tax=Cohnella soli TaxID=425005 RepID=A0ABW0I1G4_9BACL
MKFSYHEGELAVQKLANASDQANKSANSVLDYFPRSASDFLLRLTFIIAATLDERHRAWASLLSGPEGFISVADERTVHIRPPVRDGDTLQQHLLAHDAIGLLAIEPSSRRRMRINGTVLDKLPEIVVFAEQIYTNCPKYIRNRVPLYEMSPKGTTITSELNETYNEWIASADTFYIASASRDNKPDVSHRGGPPSFVKVLDEKTLIFPDYSGNSMFNTLGNIHENPTCGLLFIDYAKGDTLQLTGLAEIIWESSMMSEFPDAKRLVKFRLSIAVHRFDAQKGG